MKNSTHGDQAAVWAVVRRVELPDKKYFKIGEVANLVGVETHVLRYWETQFSQVRPQKSRSGHRQYRRKEVENLLAIRELLHVQGFTIAGAKRTLREHPRYKDAVQAPRLMAPEKAVVLELHGVGQSELKTALSHELAARDGAVEQVAVGQEQSNPLSHSKDADTTLVPGPARPEASGDVLESAQLVTASTEAGSDAISSVSAPELRSGVPATSAQALYPVPQPAKAGATHQLGFGFGPTARDLLRGARSEVIGIISLLDQDDAADHRAPGARSPQS